MPNLYYSVSQLDVFREWEDDAEADIDTLVSQLTSKEVTRDMLRGRAFHSALQKIASQEQERDRIFADGFTFHFDGDFVIPEFHAQEVKGYKTYDGLRVGCRVDAIAGNHISDHKSSTWFDAERYMKKYAWRYYLDIFKADRFTWNVWEMHEVDDPNCDMWVVRDLHVLEQYRYPNLEYDCRELAARMKSFAEKHLARPVVVMTAEDILNASIKQAKSKLPFAARE